MDAANFSPAAYGATAGADITAATTLAFATAGAAVTAAALARWPHLTSTSRAELRGVNAQSGAVTVTITQPANDATVPHSRIVLVREDEASANAVTVSMSAGTFDYAEVAVNATDDGSFAIPVGGWAILERVPNSQQVRVVAGSGLTST